MADPVSPGNSSFPSPLPASDSQQAPSVISSRLTDVASEDGNEYHDERAMSSKRPPTAASNDATRPGSALSSVTRPSTRATVSKRGVPSPGSLGNWRMGGAFAAPSSTVTDISRPESSASKTSRSHVPSLASHAFFRPMSPQRLQAQRGMISSRNRMRSEGSEAETETSRHSLTTNATEQPEPLPRRDLHSRGTDFLDEDERETLHAGPNEDVTLQSVSDGEGAFRYEPQDYSPQTAEHRNAGAQHGHRPSRSPRNLSTNIIRNNAPGHREAQGHHERLSSSNNSPTFAKLPEDFKSRDERNYQYYPGNTFFCFGGRWQNTRARPVNIASGIIVLVPSILFFVYSGPYLSHHVSPAIPVIFAYLFFICISSFVHASVTDPGIFPRNLHPLPPPDNADDPLTLGPPTTQWTMVKSEGTANAAMDVPTKYCKTCNIWRPPRCHHCRVCDTCIETQDHHCVWINNCVGRRNYRYFFVFLTTSTMLGFFLSFASLGQCLRYATENATSFRESIDHNRVPFAMFLYGLLAIPYPACLWGYHLWLLARGETTREYLNSHKFLKKDRHHPFTQRTALRNWVVALLRPRPPTYLRFKARHEEGDQRYGSRRENFPAPSRLKQYGRGYELQNMQDETIRPR